MDEPAAYTLTPPADPALLTPNQLAALADALAIERYNLTRLVDKLETDRLVTRTRSREDGRAAFVAITEDGKVLRKQMWAVYQATVADLFLAQFTGGEQQDFSAALARAAEAARDAAQSKA